MRFAALLMIGFGLILALEGMTLRAAVTLSAVVGAFGGLALQIAEAKWLRPEPAYADPLNRPKRTTPFSGYLAAGAVLVISGFLAFVTWEFGISRSPALGLFGVYLVAVGIGTAIGMALTARHVSEVHNRRLAEMTPLPPLDF